MKITDKIKIRNLELKNRMYAAPMVSCYATEDGHVTPILRELYYEKARGGFGLVCVEASNVLFTGRNFDRMLGVYDDRQIGGLNELAEAIRDGGAKSCIQLQHAGRQGSRLYNGGAPVIGPSAVAPWPPGGDLPEEISTEHCSELADSFAQAAARAKAAGFDCVQLHATHGFLIQQFMSPYTNKRKDKYGDPLAFVTEVVEKTRAAVGDDYPIGIRVAADEFLGDDGITIDNFVKTFVTKLEQAGIDWFDVTSGVFETLVHWIPPLYFHKAYLTHLAEKVKQVATVPVSGIGKITGPKLAKRLVENEEIDIVAFGRQALADPAFPKKLMAGKDNDINRCICCDMGCTDRLLKQYGIRCAVNYDFAKSLDKKQIVPVASGKKVAVIGGGVAGMEAARVLALRGHHVTLYEQQSTLGGAVLLASAIPKLETGELALVVSRLKKDLDALPVEVKLNTTVTPDLLQEMDPDAVVLATGARPIKPSIPGVDKDTVLTADDFLKTRIRSGEKVVVLGGNYGAEVAVSLARLGKKVTVVEETAATAATPYIYLGRMLVLQGYMSEEGVEILTETRAKEIEDNAVVVTDQTGEDKRIECDAVILAQGREPNRELVDFLEGRGAELHVVGDCSSPENIYRAIHEASVAAREI